MAASSAYLSNTEKSENLRFAKTTALLLTIVFMSYYYYGIRAVYVAGISVLSSTFSDYIACTARRRKFDWTDTSPVMSGLLLALMMPASVPYTVIAFSAAFMSLICKNAFGGNKNLIFCPVCISYIFTVFCFPSAILRYPVPVPFGKLSLANTVTDQLTHSYTYTLDNGSSSAFNLLDVVWGRLAGPMGASAILIIMICALALYFFGDIPPAAFFSGLGLNVLLSVMFPTGDAGWYAVLNSFVAGSYLFVLVFMACDPRYVPSRIFSQILYGLLFAGASFLIRRYTSIENSSVFSLSILCIFRDELDHLTNGLEKLLKFLWKWIRILSVRLAKAVAKYTAAAARFTWKYLVISVKFLVRQLNRFFDFIALKISNAMDEKKKKKDVKDSSEKAGGTSDGGMNDIQKDQTEKEADNEKSD